MIGHFWSYPDGNIRYVLFLWETCYEKRPSICLESIKEVPKYYIFICDIEAVYEPTSLTVTNNWSP